MNYNDLKKFSSDFKEVYNAPSETAALTELENMKEKWGKKYPYAISNWENNWEDVSSFLQFSNDIRRIMYTTNVIEGLNRQYRKVTKTKSVFPSDSALEKMLYLASENVVKKWTQRYRNWDQVLNQLIVLYGDGLLIICKRKKAGMEKLLQANPFPLFVYSFGICIIARNFLFYSRGRVWAEPTKRQ